MSLIDLAVYFKLVLELINFHCHCYFKITTDWIQILPREAVVRKDFSNWHPKSLDSLG